MRTTLLIGGLMQQARVYEMRLVVTADDYEEALHFYRDVLGLKELAAFASEGGHVTILDAGAATLELADSRHAAFIDEVEVGRRVAGHVRVAFKVDDSAGLTQTLQKAGATVLADVRRTPWNSLNSRFEAPAGLQLTLFSEPDSRSQNR
jgi:catechol 2,3-dioxygenase-like lactoylglutathione lyase family enzyme